MARRGRRLVALFIVLAVVFWRTARNRSERSEAAVSDTATFVATAQEGLGASVAIVIDNSGSMDDPPSEGGSESKGAIARAVLDQVLAQTDSFATARPEFPINVGLYTFSDKLREALPISRFDRGQVSAALQALPHPRGGTAIGDAMRGVIEPLYGAGTIRKYILILTDGENTKGQDPAEVAEEISRRSEGAVKIFLVAFDIEGSKFQFVSDVRGMLVEAKNALGLRASLDTLYRGRILAEAMNAGEPLADTAGKK